MHRVSVLPDQGREIVRTQLHGGCVVVRVHADAPRLSEKRGVEVELHLALGFFHLREQKLRLRLYFVQPQSEVVHRKRRQEQVYEQLAADQPEKGAVGALYEASGAFHICGANISGRRYFARCAEMNFMEKGPAEKQVLFLVERPQPTMNTLRNWSGHPQAPPRSRPAECHQL